MKFIKIKFLFTFFALVAFAACQPKDANTNNTLNPAPTPTNNAAVAPTPEPTNTKNKLTKFPEQPLPFEISQKTANNPNFLSLSATDAEWLEKEYNLRLDVSANELPRAGFRLKISDNRHLIAVIVDADIPNGVVQSIHLQIIDNEGNSVGESFLINTYHEIANQYTAGSTECTFTFSATNITAKCTEIISDPMGEKDDEKTTSSLVYIISDEGITPKK